jgi:hypothetical protein
MEEKYKGALKCFRANNGNKNEFVISKLFLFFNINPAAHFLIFENEGEESPINFYELRMNFIWR